MLLLHFIGSEYTANETFGPVLPETPQDLIRFLLQFPFVTLHLTRAHTVKGLFEACLTHIIADS